MVIELRGFMWEHHFDDNERTLRSSAYRWNLRSTSMRLMKNKDKSSNPVTFTVMYIDSWLLVNGYNASREHRST